jgi:4-amino-4-deoxy-L-arabinose transferase-like glycosyltransferase
LSETDVPAPHPQTGRLTRLGRNPRITRNVVVAGVLACYGGLGVWNLSRFPWSRSYDAAASDLYVQTLAHSHRLPGPLDTDVWHNPPLFYLVAGAVGRVGRLAGVEPHHIVQYLSLACGLATLGLAYATARLLFPRSAWIQLGTLLVAAATPVLMRGSLMYHPEPLATALSAAGVYAAARAVARRPTAIAGAAAGLVLGLSNLTRTWALAETAAVAVVLGYVWFTERSPDTRRFLVVLLTVWAVCSVPWYVTETVRFGDPLAFSRPNPAEWKGRGRPLEFFTALDAHAVFTNPYKPTYRNVLVPVVYTDWWGDYSRYFHVPASMTNAPRVLPAKYRRPLVLQSIVGLLPTLLALAGALALGRQLVRRRSAALAIVLGAGASVAVSFVAFLVQFPKLDGDNIKALYILDLVVPVALCTAYGLDVVRRVAPRPAFLLLLAALAAAAAVDAHFLVL